MTKIANMETQLKPERVAELRLQAKKKVQAEKQKAVEAELLKAFEREERVTRGLEEPTETVYIDLDAVTDRIVIDGRVFVHGQFVKDVPASQAEVLREQMARLEAHTREIKGEKRFDPYRRESNPHISAFGRSG